MELPKTKYKGIYPFISNGKSIYWIAHKTYKGKRYKKTLTTERDAALAYDKMCLSFGLKPVNILKNKI